MKSISLTRPEVLSIPAPQFTKSWHPMAHSAVIGALDMILGSEQIGVVRERYDVTKDGANMFGSWTLDIGNGTKIQLGFRNSTCKAFAIGVCSGTWVMVCSNMCFSGDFVEFRKHTSGLDYDELLEIGGRSIKTVVANGKKQIGWQDNLVTYPVSPARFKMLTYDAMAEGVLPPSNFAAFLDSYNEETTLSKRETLYEFHGAVTRLSRTSSLFTINHRTVALNALCDRYTGPVRTR
jgi:hypothetical protein